MSHVRTSDCHNRFGIAVVAALISGVDGSSMGHCDEIDFFGLVDVVAHNVSS